MKGKADCQLWQSAFFMGDLILRLQREFREHANG